MISKHLVLNLFLLFIFTEILSKTISFKLSTGELIVTTNGYIEHNQLVDQLNGKSISSTNDLKNGSTNSSTNNSTNSSTNNSTNSSTNNSTNSSTNNSIQTSTELSNATNTKVETKVQTPNIVQHEQPINYCPSNCTCKLLDLNHQSNNNLEIKHCLYLNLSQLVNASQFKLYLQFHPFQLHQLKEFNLNFNNLTRINENLILNPRHNLTIESLSLSHNQLNRFPKIRQTSSLKYLNLDHNAIVYLNNSRAEIYPFKNLLWLNLNHNRIKLIRRTFLRLICTKLKYIDLSHNKLIRLDDKLFVNCKQLEILKLNRNRLSKFESNVFENLTNLIELDLSRNNLTNLKTDNFKSLMNLKILNLAKNSLQSLDENTFEHLTNLTNLNLNENKLVNLSQNTFKGLINLKLLQLSNNQIKSIDVNWYESKNLVNLYLEHNQIDHIESMTFKGLINLEKLYLDYNLIRSIEKNAFQTNPNLIWLFLNDNYLNNQIEKNRTLFVHHHLQHLALERNHLTYIPNTIFNNLTTLVTIDLGLNQIKYIEENALKELNKLDELNWDSTDLICDCSMKWFVKYYQEKSIENIYLEQLECKMPKNLRNKLFIDVNENLFLCKEDYKHQFIKEPKKYQLISQNKKFFLKCKVSTNSYLNEDIIFEWRKNNQTLLLNNERNIVEHMYLDKDKDFSINHKLIYSSSLEFRNASIKDEGEYYCVANNSYASIQSQIAQVIISKPPEFVLSANQLNYSSNPIDELNLVQTTLKQNEISNSIRSLREETIKTDHLKVKLGEDIKIDCNVIGFPKPKLSLHKNNNLNFLFTIKNRIQFDKQKFIIKNATLEDQGMYICIAVNGLGKATKNITVDVLSAPIFIQTGQTENNQSRYLEGETILINCYANGNPKVQIIWKKDELLLETDSKMNSKMNPKMNSKTNSKINFNNRFNLKFDRQVLIIKNSKQSDSGFYQCILKNELGNLTLFKRIQILSSDQMKLNYIQDNWYLILVLIVILIWLLIVIKLLMIYLLKNLFHRFSKKSTFENSNVLNSNNVSNRLMNTLNSKRSNRTIYNPKLNEKDQNERLLNQTTNLKDVDFSSKYLAKNELDYLTKLISYKKVHSSLDNLNLTKPTYQIKVPIKKVQFDLETNK